SPRSPANRRPASWDIRGGQSSRPRFAVAPGAPRVELMNLGTSAVEGGAQPASEYAIGIDVGGTKIAAGLVEFPTATVIGRLVMPTLPRRGARAVLDDVHELARQLARLAPEGRRSVGVGIGVPELVDLSGRIASAETIDWCDLPIRAQLADCGPVVLESDVRASAAAEARWGAGRGRRWFAFVGVGTGISSALVLEQRVLTGARGNGLVLGSGRYAL